MYNNYEQNLWFVQQGIMKVVGDFIFRYQRFQTYDLKGKENPKWVTNISK